jgi:hypothetical protein
MGSGPIQRERWPKLVSVFAAHDRRAQLIAQIEEQAIAAANADRLAQQAAEVARHSRWRNADRVIVAGILKMIAVAAVITALVSLLVLWR